MTQTRGSVEKARGESTRGRWARVAGGALAAGAALALVAGVGAAGAAPSADAEPHKSYVCKYVSKPGEATERLQTGKNPIWVDNHALLGYDGPVRVGQEFKDGQRRSVVIVANTVKLKPEPSVAACPPATPPTKTTTTPPTTKTTPPTTKTTPPTTKTTPPTTKTTTPPATTPGTTAAPAPSTYPLLPVMGGADEGAAITSAGSTGQLPVTPVQALLVALALLGLLVALGVRLPRVVRPGGGEDA
ncbi:hypothetical protein [Humibacillus xanthopallidus]|uniref:hypothetical protein n=1 Tax=Humibacillus xanthopallidus TaxID=412689 RepID=UPI00384B62D4